MEIFKDELSISVSEDDEPCSKSCDQDVNQPK